MYYKKVNLNSNKECFEFLAGHFTYDTLNSWNGLHSIANNVKVYNLPVSYEDAMEALERDEYLSINMAIKDWEEDHPGTKVGFNGRSGGYLVLYSDRHNGHIFDDDNCSPCHKFMDYENWKGCVQEDYGSLQAYHQTLIHEVKLVQDFDKLCDDLVNILKSLIEDMNYEKEHTHFFEATQTYATYKYETIDDLKRHKQYMLNKGYALYDYNEEELYAEYSMNEYVKGEVLIEEDK